MQDGLLFHESSNMTRTVRIHQVDEKIAGNVNSASYARLKFARIALTYYFENHKRHKHFM